MARMRVLCALAAAALALLCAPPAAAASRKNAIFTASLAPLPNTTGVTLGGSGFARVAFNPRDSTFSKLTLDVTDLVRPRNLAAQLA